MVHEFAKNPSSKFLVRGALNFDNRTNWYSIMRQYGVIILKESKLLVIAVTKNGFKNDQDF